jgi:hypothetical protein
LISQAKRASLDMLSAYSAAGFPFACIKSSRKYLSDTRMELPSACPLVYKFFYILDVYWQLRVLQILVVCLLLYIMYLFAGIFYVNL